MYRTFKSITWPINVEKAKVKTAKDGQASKISMFGMIHVTLNIQPNTNLPTRFDTAA